MKNVHGLHARPCAAIIRTLSHFTADAQLYKGEKKANAKSLNSIAVLGVRLNDTITLHAQGVDASALINAFAQLAEDNFGESIDAEKETKATQVDKLDIDPSIKTDVNLCGAIVCEGIAHGVAFIFNEEKPKPVTCSFTSEKKEIRRLDEAIKQVSQQIESLINAENKPEEQANIFGAHLMMLTDCEFLDDIQTKIAQQNNAEQAVYAIISELAQNFRDTSNEYMQAREADVWDLGRQIMCALNVRQNNQPLKLTSPAIIFAEQLSPSNIANLDPKMAQGICLESGTTNSHCAILAKAFGIPCLVKVSGCLESVKQGDFVCVDAFEGRLLLGSEATAQKPMQTMAYNA